MIYNTMWKFYGSEPVVFAERDLECSWSEKKCVEPFIQYAITAIYLRHAFKNSNTISLLSVRSLDKSDREDQYT